MHVRLGTTARARAVAVSCENPGCKHASPSARFVGVMFYMDKKAQRKWTMKGLGSDGATFGRDCFVAIDNRLMCMSCAGFKNGKLAVKKFLKRDWMWLDGQKSSCERLLPSKLKTIEYAYGFGHVYEDLKDDIDAAVDRLTPAELESARAMMSYVQDNWDDIRVSDDGYDPCSPHDFCPLGHVGAMVYRSENKLLADYSPSARTKRSHAAR